MPNKLELKIKKLFKDYTCKIGIYSIVLTQKVNKTTNKIITINDKVYTMVECEYEEKTSHSTRYVPGVLSFDEIKNLSKIVKLIEKKERKEERNIICQQK